MTVLRPKDPHHHHRGLLAARTAEGWYWLDMPVIGRHNIAPFGYRFKLAFLR